MKKRFCALIAALVCAFCLAGAALAAELPSIPEGSNYVFDPDNVIIDTYDPQLDEQAAHITADYACGVYILAVRDFTSYGYGISRPLPRISTWKTIWGMGRTGTAFCWLSVRTPGTSVSFPMAISEMPLSQTMGKTLCGIRFYPISGITTALTALLTILPFAKTCCPRPRAARRWMCPVLIRSPSICRRPWAVRRPCASCLPPSLLS